MTKKKKKKKKKKKCALKLRKDFVPDTPDAWEQSPSQTRSEVAEELIDELRKQVAADRSTMFNRTFLAQITNNPDMTIRECWEATEDHFAKKGGVRPEQYPYPFDN